jgi:predicted dehydrogenase
MSATDVRIGIVGAGLMGREIASAIQRWPALIDHPVRARVTAVCDINPAALSWFDQIDTVRLKTTRFEDLLEDDSIDVLYIAVRHDLHEQMYLDAIRSGKDLLAEKPFGIDGAAARRITDALAANPGAFVRCSSEMPFFPGAQMAIRYVQSGAIGRPIEARSAFLHSSDLDTAKPLNWKRQNRYCGEAGVMNDLGMHVWHVPLRLGWQITPVFGELQNLVPERPDGNGGVGVCDTWENATVHSRAEARGVGFPLTTEMKRIAPGHKNTWEFEIVGMEGGVRFSTKNPKRVEVFATSEIAGSAREQVWQQIDSGSQSVWPTVTGGNFESGFSDSILQMWSAFLAERAGALGDGFGCATPAEALRAHEIHEFVMRNPVAGL